jgi:hypothetical protein
LAHVCHKNHWNWPKNEQDMAYGSEGSENVRFKHKKNQFFLKLKIYIHWFIVLATSTIICKALNFTPIAF